MSTFQSHRAQPPSTTPRSSRHAERAAGLTVVTAGWPPRHLPTHCLSPAPVFSIFFRVGCSLLLSSSRDFKHAPHRGGKFRSNRNGSGCSCACDSWGLFTGRRYRASQSVQMGNLRLEIIHILLCLVFEVFTYFVLCFNLIRTYLEQREATAAIGRSSPVAVRFWGAISVTVR